MFKKTRGKKQKEEFSEDLLLFVMLKNNKRMILSFFSILALANIATVAIKMSGKGSESLSYISIGVEILLSFSALFIGYYFAPRMKNIKYSSYFSITSVLLCLLVYQYFIFGASEIFATFYIAFGLSVLYFDRNASLYTFLLIVAIQIILFIARPELIPGGPKSNIMVRFLVYIWVAIGTTAGANATRKILNLAVKKQKEAKYNLDKLKQLAFAILQAIELMKVQTVNQEKISADLNDISQHQVSSLGEISESLGSLTSNSEDINQIAKSLYKESETSMQSVSNLKTINDKVQKSTMEIYNTLNDVMDYSSRTSDHIQLSIEKFNILKEKSEEMSSFVQVINEIADRVNLLSLNASIEAARAGEYGKGFAVVAQEISKLADATALNSKHISGIIGENKDLLDQSSELINQSSGMIKKLDEAISVIKDEISGVGTQIKNIDSAIIGVENLNAKIHETSKTIENSTNSQKLATVESNTATINVSGYAKNIVEISKNITENNKSTGTIISQLGTMAQDMTV